MPENVHPFFFGAALVALEKKSGVAQPIVVDCILQRLVAKVAGCLVVDVMVQDD